MNSVFGNLKVYEPYSAGEFECLRPRPGSRQVSQDVRLFSGNKSVSSSQISTPKRVAANINPLSLFSSNAATGVNICSVDKMLGVQTSMARKRSIYMCIT